MNIGPTAPREITTSSGSIADRLRQVSGLLDFDNLLEIDRDLRELPDDFASAELVQSMHEVIMLWHFHGRDSSSKALSKKAIRWSQLLNDQRLLRRALNCRAGVAVSELDIGDAVASLTQALEIARSSNDLRGIVVSYRNLGLCCGRLGMNDLQMKLAFAGLELLNERRVELPGEEVKLLECMCEFVISDGLLGTDEPGPALEVLKRVQEAGKALLPKLAAEDKAQLSLGLHQARSFELQALVRLGLRDEARELARLVAEEVHATRNEMKVVDGKWALAEFLAADGHIGEAIKVLDDLLAEPTSNHAKNELMFTLAACYSAAGQHTEAMRTLHELRSHVEHVRQTAAIATAESIAVLCDDQDATFERAVQRSATTFAVAQESARSQTHKKLVYLTEIAISAEFDESSELRGAWHPVRVGVLARLVAQAAGLDADLCWQAEVAGRLHDVGKCAIPDRLKLKAGPLSDEERLLVREHAEFGARLLEAVNEPTLAAAALGIRHHHERYDGRGYPQGLSGEQIPIVARLVALCESFDAMMLRRKFRATKRTLPDALREVVFCSGTQFDPLLAHVLVEVIHRLESSSGNAMMQLEALGRESAQVESFERISSILAVRNCATFPSASASG